MVVVEALPSGWCGWSANDVCQEVTCGAWWNGGASERADGVGGPASAAGECQSQLRDAELFIITMLYSRVTIF